MHYDETSVPADGEAITINRDHTIKVPEKPIVPYIVADGIGVDASPVMKDVVDSADLIIKGVANTIANEELTFDLAKIRAAIRAPKRKAEPHDKKEVEVEFEQLIAGAKLLGTEGFGDAVIRHMDD